MVYPATMNSPDWSAFLMRMIRRTALAFRLSPAMLQQRYDESKRPKLYSLQGRRSRAAIAKSSFGKVGPTRQTFPWKEPAGEKSAAAHSD
jgi:hypothetical protein